MRRMPTRAEAARRPASARRLRDSRASGELRAAPSYGKPLAFGDGYDETPAELRMAMKILKDAGVVPHEVELMREAARCRRASTPATIASGASRCCGGSLPSCGSTSRCAWSKLRISGSL